MELNQDLEARIAQSRRQPNFVELSALQTGECYWFERIVERDDGKEGEWNHKSWKHTLFPGQAVVVNGEPAVWSSAHRAPVFLRDVPGVFGAKSIGPYQSKIMLSRMHDSDGNYDLAYKVWCAAQDMMTPEMWEERNRARRRLFVGMTPPEEWKPKIVKDQIEAALKDLGVEDLKPEQVPASMYDRLLARVGLQRIKKGQ